MKFYWKTEKKTPDLYIVYPDHLLKLKKRIQKFNYKSDSKPIYHNRLEKACFQHVATYDNLKNLPGIAVSDNVSRAQ